MCRLFLILTLAFLSACTTIGKQYEPAPLSPAGKSLVYLFRGNVSFGNFWITNFLINGEEVVSLYDKGYSWVHLAPGEHMFEANTPTQNNLKIRVPMEPDSVYYIGYTQEPSGFRTVRNVLKTYQGGEARSLMQTMSYKEANKIVKEPVGEKTGSAAK